MNVYALGASRNIGYYAAVRLLDKGATITFLLRSPAVFENDEVMQRYIKSGHARVVKGDAHKPEDVARGWQVAQEGPNSHVDTVLFSIGAPPQFSWSKGVFISPHDLCTRGFLNLVRTLPAALRSPDTQPKIIIVSSTGMTKASHARLPWIWRVLYPFLAGSPHRDKLGMERAIAHFAGWDWEDPEPRAVILPTNWRDVPGTPQEGELRRVLVVRAAFLMDGECKGDVARNGGHKPPYRIGKGDVDSGYSVSRKDVAHFIVEGALTDWKRWENCYMSIAY